MCIRDRVHAAGRNGNKTIYQWTHHGTNIRSKGKEGDGLTSCFTWEPVSYTHLDVYKRQDLIFWVNMAFAGVMWIIASAIPETYAPVILKRKAARLRKETGNPKIMTEQEAQGISMGEMMRGCLLRPLYFSVTEPVLVATCFYVCLIYSLLYCLLYTSRCV